jgi:pSer/pThr/pTyr-binding forkhead associated (FHA) protein
MESSAIYQWSSSDVKNWLKSLDLSQYTKNFEELRIDGKLLLEITEADLTNDLSIQVRLHRFKILESIRSLKSQQPDQSENLDWSGLTLKAVEGQSKNKEFDVTFSGASIGRHSGSNTFVINESFVSRKHCEIRFCQGSNRFLLKDLGSTTGTFVMVKKQVKLRINDLFQMGTSEFKVTVVKFSPQGLPISLVLKGYEGPVRGKEIIVDKNGASIGRDGENTIVVSDDSQMSAKHGKISFRKKNFVLEDLGSTNKTWKRLSEEGQKSEDFHMVLDDFIKIGSTVLLVQLCSFMCNKENVNEEDACKICFTYEPDTLCYPCGHLFCFGCLRKCSQCPICRTDINDKVKVFK